MYKINFNHLYYFLTISKEGSIVKASKKLHMTQPALSHQLRLLEEDLGNTCYFALHYLTHTASETGGYSTSELMEDLGEDDTATSIVLEYGHRWTVGSAWGFDLTYAPNITYAMNSYSWDVSANDDAKGAAESALAWNWIKFDVLF